MVDIGRGEPALYTGVPVIHRRVGGRLHRDQLVPLDTGIELTPYAAKSAGGSHPFVGISRGAQLFFFQRANRTFIHTGAAAHAIRFFKRFIGASNDSAIKTASIN